MTDDHQARSEAAAACVRGVVAAVWNTGDLDAIPDWYDPGHVRHAPGADVGGGAGVGFGPVAAAVASMRAAFPGHTQDEYLLVADGDRVFRHWGATGTRHAPDGSASAAPVVFDATSIWQVRDGKVVASRTEIDRAALDRQVAGEPWRGDRTRHPAVVGEPGPMPRTAMLREATAFATALAAGDLEWLPGVVTEDHRDHRGVDPDGIGLAGLRERAAALATRTGGTLRVDEATTVAAGEWVGFAWTGATPGSGGQTLLRFRGDRVAEGWWFPDQAV